MVLDLSDPPSNLYILKFKSYFQDSAPSVQGSKMHHSQILIIFSIINWPEMAPGDSLSKVIGGAPHCERDILLNMEILLRSCLPPCVGTDGE